MAEVAASMVVGPLLNLVKNKVSSYLLVQYKVMEGLEKQHEILKRWLPEILDVIADAEKQASHRQGVKPWLAKLKAVAYEANDVFDDFEYEALRRRAKKNGHITKLGMAGVKLIPTHNRLAFRLKMGNKLGSIVDTIKVLVDDMNEFGFNKLHPKPQSRTDLELRQADSVIVDPNIVRKSRDKERKKIVDILMHGKASDDGLMVVPLFGMGGLGKTTLAQLIYNDPQVQEHFHQLRRWVCVSDDFDVHDLANKICESSEQSREGALNKLQEQLRGNKYLLVLDDIWDEENFQEKWEKLKACLKQGSVGSAILTTTRNMKIAELMGTVDISLEKKYHVVPALRKEFIEEIIETRAFGLHKTNRKDELVNLVGPIADRCHGFPLAAKALGYVLGNKTTKEEWEDILQRSNICDGETRILPVLKLSYDDLPTEKKQCFAFCAIYPKDYEIDVDKLIQLWMANGFISDLNKVPAEIVGEQIVKEMVSRSFFEYVDKDPTRFGYCSTTFLKIHDLMHDVAVFASEKESVCITNEMIQSSELLSDAARHIYCQEKSKKGLAILHRSIRNMSIPIQTLMFGALYDADMQHSSNFSSLRALAMPRLRDNLLIKPKHLGHLRYLDLSGSDIKALPDDISILYSLQTLKLSDCEELGELPDQMKYMTALRHLYTDGCYKLQCMPPELGLLTSLRTVTCFVVGSGSECSSLGELKDLNIGGSMELKHLENVTGESAKAANLVNKKDLRRLTLRWTEGKGEEKQCHEVLEALNAHAGLRALEIYSYQGTSFPSWMGMLRNMVELRLSDCSKIRQLPLLCHLPELQVLELHGPEKLQFLCSSCTSSTFRKLKDLGLCDLDEFSRFFEVVQQGEEVVAFPQLEILHIANCKSLTALPEAAVLREPFGGAEYTVARSAFPKLKSLTLERLPSFERWEPAALGTEAEQPALLFPLLESAWIKECPQLITSLPRAPKLIELDVRQANKRMSKELEAATYLTSLSSLSLSEVNVDGNENWGHMSSSVTYMRLASCRGFFLQSRAAELALWWSCFVKQLQTLAIWYCDELVYWPEKEFRSLVSLRRLQIDNCDSLIGYAPPDPQQQQPRRRTEQERRQVLPRLESLRIRGCERLVEILSTPPALKRMDVGGCDKLESLNLLSAGAGFKEHQDKATSSSSAALNHSSSSAALNHYHQALLKRLSTEFFDGLSEDLGLLPSSSASVLESLSIMGCHGLSEVLGLPPSLTEIYIKSCPKLRSLSSSAGGQLDALNLPLAHHRSCMGDLPALEVLVLRSCKSLASLPSWSGPQAYSSLRRLTITGCPGLIIKSLPSALQQRLDSLEEKDLDARYEQGLLGRLYSTLSSPRLC